MSSQFDNHFMLLAVSEAENFVGATTPNPPVGACIVKNDKVLGLGAHAQAGTSHAEVIAIENAFKNFGADALIGSTLYVTLEPCNHTGLTPPCTEFISRTGIKEVVFGVKDPNPKVTGGGSEHLKNAGIKVRTGPAKRECERLIAPFKKFITEHKPWITHKIAYRVARSGELSMLPEEGATTFTSQQSLEIAHIERRKSDAILTGIGTVKSDFPQFNVRFVPDHPNRKRFLVVMSKDGEAPPQDWLEQEWDLGFEVLVMQDLETVLQQLADFGVQRLLVEAGPGLSKTFIDNKLWDERLLFLQHISVNHQVGTIKPCDYINREFKDKSLI